MNLSLKIDTVDNISFQTFRRDYFDTQKPLLIRGGLVKQAPASSKWSIEFIKEVMGELEVDIYDNKSGKSKYSAYTEGDLRMKFANYVDIITQDKPTDLRMFLFNGFKHRPGLRKDFPCPLLFEGTLSKIGFMFFGGKGTTVRMHQDMDMSNVLLTQFVGRKRVVLFAPEYTPFLYRIPFNTFSIVDMENPDYEKFSALKYVKGYEVILEPGDSLYMPSGYWHYITYLEGGFAVSYRKLSASLGMRFKALCLLTVFMWLDKTLGKLIPESWVAYKERFAIHKAEKAMEDLEKIDNVFADYGYQKA